MSRRFDGGTRIAAGASAGLAKLTPPSMLTIEARVYLEENAANRTCILSKGAVSVREYHVFVTLDNRVLVGFTLSDGTKVEVETLRDAIARRRWHLISCVIDVLRMQVLIFVDGSRHIERPLARP